MASIKDVAKRAQVAKSTVSLVVNQTGYVSDETRAKVEQAIQELNYTPSQLGRNLSKNRTNLIGISIPDVSHPFFGTLVKYIEEALYQKGYKTMLCATVEKENMEQEFLSMLRSHTMDGIIMGAHSLLQEQYMHLKQPVVAFDRDLGQGIPLIQADHIYGGRMAAEMFARHGCRKVVQISGALIVNTPAHQCHVSFKRALKERGIETHVIEMAHNAFREEDFEQTAKLIFDRYPDVDGIFGADLLILASLKEGIRQGRKIPEELKLLAYDGTYVTRLGPQTIDAVVQPIREMAYACAGTMDFLVQGKRVPNMRQVFPVSYQPGAIFGDY